MGFALATDSQVRTLTAATDRDVGSSAIFDLLPTPLAVADDHGRIVLANREVTDFTGEDLRGHPLAEFVHPDDRRGLLRAWRGSLVHGGDMRHDARLRHHQDGYRWVRVTARRHMVDGSVQWIGSGVDIQATVTARCESDQRDLWHTQMLDASADCIKLINPDGTLRLMNRAGCAALGLPLDEQEFGMPWLDLLPTQVHGQARRALRAARQGKQVRFDGMSMVGGRRPQHWDNLLTPILDEAGRTSFIVCVSRDSTTQQDTERRLRTVSEVDHLTGLLNRRAFELRLRRMVGRARQNGYDVGLILLDLDHFKNINDSLGHPAGDHLLRVISRRLRRAMPAGTAIGRIGGDEFAVLAPSPADPGLLARLAHAQANPPILYRGQPIGAGMSVGVATFPRDAADGPDLLARADAALNDLKAAGRGGVREFGSRMRQAGERRARHLACARDILDDGVVEAYYQPKVRLADGALVGFEALLRWGHAPGSGRLPGEIAAAFDDYELATALGARMRQRVIADVARWLAAGLRPGPVSVNAAPVEFLRDDFVDRFLDDLRRHDVPPSAVEVEITEPVFLQRHADFVHHSLKALHAAGLRITLDDFGTGRSSLVDLGAFPVDGLKIHQNFIDRIVDEPSIHDMVRAIIQLGSTLHLAVTAEGVETQQQLALLRTAGGDVIGQGFLFGAAVPSSEATALLAGPPTVDP